MTVRPSIDPSAPSLRFFGRDDIEKLSFRARPKAESRNLWGDGSEFKIQNWEEGWDEASTYDDPSG